MGAERAGECDGLTGLPEATRGHLAPVRGPDLRGYHLIRSSMRFVPYKDRRRAAAAPRRTRTALGEEAALGALEDFAESDPGPATPRRWRRGRGPRPVHAVPGLPAHGAPRRVSPTGAGGAPSTNAIESLNYQLRKGDQEPRSLPLRRGRGRTTVASRPATATNAPANATRTRANPPANAPPHPVSSKANSPPTGNKPSPNSPPPTPTGSPPTSNPHTQKK